MIFRARRAVGNFHVADFQAVPVEAAIAFRSKQDQTILRISGNAGKEGGASRLVIQASIAIITDATRCKPGAAQRWETKK
jgi:hypothetical protein